MQTVLIRDGVVTEVLKPVDGHELADCFPEALLAGAVQAPDAVQPGWTYDGKAFAVPAPIVTAPVVRTAPGTALVHVLDKTTKVCPRDLAYVAGLSAAREDMLSLIRIAAVDGRAVSVWFDTALTSAT